jgi:hypothetical protein
VRIVEYIFGINAADILIIGRTTAGIKYDTKKMSRF